MDSLRQVEEYYRKRTAAGKRLKELNDTYLSRLHDVNENITPLFSHFASRFLGTTWILPEKSASRADLVMKNIDIRHLQEYCVAALVGS